MSVNLLGEEISHVIEVLFEEELIEFLGLKMGSSTVAGRIGAVEHVYFFDAGQNDLILMIMLVFPEFVVSFEITDDGMVLNGVMEGLEAKLAFTG